MDLRAGEPGTGLALTRAEAEHLRAALCRALDGQPVPPAAPDFGRPSRPAAVQQQATGKQTVRTG
ncbi:hypothetical protein ACKI1J_06345 [Streptomyces scabiei]|uniref:hypothetical protein n=1 Tax=Streptomyces scabiei TaxID=1930 RepID=UPI0038F81C9F